MCLVGSALVGSDDCTVKSRKVKLFCWSVLGLACSTSCAPCLNPGRRFGYSWLSSRMSLEWNQIHCLQATPCCPRPLPRDGVILTSSIGFFQGGWPHPAEAAEICQLKLALPASLRQKAEASFGWLLLPSSSFSLFFVCRPTRLQTCRCHSSMSKT